ncbi:MAG TPA: VCBS repeat-containing protein [Chthonomonadales bacterium]|nr:VCBS repeat-containing protein [Chthonomonadales bacterium]
MSRSPVVRYRKRAINASSDFEAACAADIDGDGRLDIVSGDTWYQAPDWTPHPFRKIAVWGRGPGESGYRSDFADLPLDVNGDGRIDIVSCAYDTGEIYWHENVGGSADWPRHEVARPGSMETMVFAPILGRGHRPAILPNCAGQVVWYELRRAGARPEWVEHVVGKEGAAHGIGWGDVDGDGKVDIITPHGWYQQVDAARDRWNWRPEWECNPGDCGIGMPVYDIDGDGLNDIVFGSGHHYGVYWLQQQPHGSRNRWVQRAIDSSWSQAHALILTSMDRRHRPAVLTGKRYRAHDTDPGADEPLGLYFYWFNRKRRRWQKYTVDYGTQTGTGLQLTSVDLRRTGRLDIIAPGKSGLYLFENMGRQKPE